MRKHYCPVCLKPQPIAWCMKHGSFYSVDNRTATTQPGTLTRAETAKLLKENRNRRGKGRLEPGAGNWRVKADEMRADGASLPPPAKEPASTKKKIPITGGWIEESTVNRGWHTVHVEPGGLVTSSGKTLPYGFTVGVIRPNGKIEVWRPAAGGIPRDYTQAAKSMLERARDVLGVSGEKRQKKKPATGLDKEPSKAQKSVDMSRLLPHGKGVFVQWSIPNSRWQVMFKPEGAKSRAEIQVFGLFATWSETADYLKRFL